MLVEKVGSTDSTALHLTAIDGHFEAAKALLEAGAPLLETNKFNETLFHIAARKNHFEYLKKLLDHI